MLEIILPKTESYDESKHEFIMYSEYKLQLEHSLQSLSKWESKWEKPFLSDEPRTDEQTLDYIRCMTLTEDHTHNLEHAYTRLTNEDYLRISEYIQASMTATWFNDKNSKPSREVITAEIIYYWMIAHNVPAQYDQWHLNRLMALLKVCSLKSQPDKKMSRQEILQRNARLNAERKAKFNTTG